MIYDDERIDDLQCKGYQLIQKPKGFCFGIDAVLLSGFAKVKRGQKVLDLCTGSGVIPILLEAKTEGSTFTGLELQEAYADMASRSVRTSFFSSWDGESSLHDGPPRFAKCLRTEDDCKA